MQEVGFFLPFSLTPLGNDTPPPPLPRIKTDFGNGRTNYKYIIINHLTYKLTLQYRYK